MRVAHPTSNRAPSRAASRRRKDNTCLKAAWSLSVFGTMKCIDGAAMRSTVLKVMTRLYGGAGVSSLFGSNEDTLFWSLNQKGSLDIVQSSSEMALQH